VLAQAPQAWAQTPGPPVARELFIGAKVALPFAMKAEDGSSILFYSALLQRWSGIVVASDAGITRWPIKRNVFSLRKSL
jgi:hypothetical protein